MRWYKWLHIAVMAMMFVFVFVPGVVDRFPFLFLLLIALIVVMAPISGAIAVKKWRRPSEK